LGPFFCVNGGTPQKSRLGSMPWAQVRDLIWRRCEKLSMAT